MEDEASVTDKKIVHMSMKAEGTCLAMPSKLSLTGHYPLTSYYD